MLIEYLKGNIIDAEVDAIVVPSNKKLKEGTGTSKAIYEAAGKRELAYECKKIIEIRNSLEIGSAIPTSAYALSCKYLIHAVVPKWIDGKHDEYVKLSTAYKTALELADYIGCRSIAFPLLASGNNKFDPSIAFDIAKDNLERFSGKQISKAVMVLYSDKTASIAESRGCRVETLNTKPIIMNETELEKTRRREEIMNKAAMLGQDAANAALDYLNKPEVKKAIFNAAASIAKDAIAAAATKLKG